MRWKRVMLIGAIAVTLGGVGAASAILLTYHEQTKIDRSNPEVVLIRYLDATFERKDPAIASLYTCSDPKGLGPLSELRDQLGTREKDYSVTILVAPGRMATTEKTVTTDLRITANKNGSIESESLESWRFGMVDEDGWRVCSAERIAKPSIPPSVAPSASP